MKIALSLFLIFVLVSNAEPFSEARLRSYQNQQDAEKVFSILQDSQFGRNLINMLSLKFKSNQKYNQLIATLDELATNINAQQATEDAEYSQTSTIYKKTISDQDKIITEATNNINSYQTTLNDKKSEASQKRSAKTLLESERDGIVRFLADLEKTRTQEKKDYGERQKDTTILLQGVQKTTTLFKSQVGNQELDADAVKKIVDLLENIAVSLQASLADDAKAEYESELKYQSFVSNRNTRLSQIETSVNGLTKDINSLDVQIAQLDSNINSEKTRRNNAQDLKSQTQTALSGLDSRYISNKDVRVRQNQLLVSVKNTLNQNPSSVTQYLNQA